MEGTLIALEDSAIIVKSDYGADTLRIAIDPRYIMNWIPGDTSFLFPFYRCDGSQISKSDLKSGMKVSVSYIISPRRGLFLQYAYLTENCPIHVSGIIKSIVRDTLEIAMDGQTATIVLTDESKLTDCKREIITKDQLSVGALAHGLVIEKNGSKLTQHLTVVDNCPYSYSAEGKVKFINNTFVKIGMIDPATGETYSEMELNLDAATVATDCLNLPIKIDEVVSGSYVNIFYRMKGLVGIADMIIVRDPCNTNYVGGIIESVNGNTIVVKTDLGEMRSAEFNDASSIVNCRGEEFVPNSAVIGSRFEGTTNDAGNGGLILNATIYTNCLEYDYVTGTISKASDSLITVMTSGGSKDVYVYENGSMIINEIGQLVDIDDLTFGRKICLVVDKTNSILLQGIVDITCENGIRNNTDGLMVMGSIQEVSNNELKVVTNNGIMQFAITPATQMMDETRNTLQASSMLPGSEVRIMTKSHNYELKPIASTVVLMSVLSVDEQELPISKLMVYPNPANSVVTFGGMDYDTITISTMLGQTIAELKNVHTFDASSLVPGSYMVRATKAGNTSVTMMQVTR
jgi:hypothetical protein